MTSKQTSNEIEVISQTKRWLETVVIGLNFCPFAGREFTKDSIRYSVLHSSDRKQILTTLALEFQRLDDHAEIETTLIILPNQLPDFHKYLDVVDLCQELLEEEDYEGTYQIASFHPSYLFTGSIESDPSNYTNRSPYPMIHILREASISKALEFFPDAEGIPQRNIDLANKKGLEVMRLLWQKCFDLE
ncbi:MAG TPA: DUF1415 domain-containing protein [Flavitalea sp.]|nr:DUF1415 domain-containing protein [Flavitalea sp.]